jgi:adenylate cyclase class IV
VRVALGVDSHRVQLEHKGPASYSDGYKVREEIGVVVDEEATLHAILSHLGYEVTREIEREIEVFAFRGATVRFETYPRMDVLVEVEGPPAAIERAIEAMGLARDSFSTDRLADFAQRFEVRTGTPAALSARELAGDFRFSDADA